MRLEGGKISSFQLLFLVIGFMVGTSVLIPPGNSAGRDTWLAILTGFTESLILFCVYMGVARKYPDKTLIEMNRIILGPWVGTLASIIFIWYVFHAGAMELRFIGEFAETIMPQTPIDIFLLITALVCAYAVSKGIEVMARCSVILVLVFIAVLVFDTLLSIPSIDMSNLLPIMDIPIKKFMLSAHSAAAYPFEEILIFIMVLPFLNRAKEGPRSLLKGMGIACLLLTFQAARNVTILADINQVSTYPSFTVVSLINIGEILSRMEMLVTLDLITMGFVKVAFFYYAATLGLAQLFKMRSYLPLILPIGLLMYLVGMSSFKTGIDEIIVYVVKTWPFYSLPFELVFPLLLLVVAVIRKFPLGADLKGGKS